MSVVVSRIASAQISYHYRYYFEIEDSLGDRFLDELDSSILSINRYPESFPIVYRDYRQVLLDKFPFRVFFRIKAERREILAVLHQREDSDRFLLELGDS